jgi:hypothetical protein
MLTSAIVVIEMFTLCGLHAKRLKYKEIVNVSWRESSQETKQKAAFQ